MKKFSKTIAMFTLSFLALACNKEDVQVVETKKASSELTLNSQRSSIDPFFILNNSERKVRMSRVKSSDQTHFFYGFEGENFAFDNDIDFLNWANEKESRFQFIEKYHFYKEQQVMAINTDIIDDEIATQRYVDKLLRDASSTGERATLSILYDNQNYQNILLPVLIAYPTMGGQKNRAESMLSPVNAGALCDKTWFRGDKFWYWALPVGGIPTFLSMNNRAESIF